MLFSEEDLEIISHLLEKHLDNERKLLVDLYNFNLSPELIALSSKNLDNLTTLYSKCLGIYHEQE